MAETLTVELPDWTKDRNIMVLAGSEWILLRGPRRTDLQGDRHGERITYRKVSRCSICGRCCIITMPQAAPFGTKKMELHGKEETVCEFLEPEKRDIDGQVQQVYVCTQRGPRVPWGCLGAHARKPYPECTVEWEKEVEHGGI
jgi:hypothetical protein